MLLVLSGLNLFPVALTDFAGASGVVEVSASDALFENTFIRWRAQAISSGVGSRPVKFLVRAIRASRSVVRPSVPRDKTSVFCHQNTLTVHF